MAEARRAEIVAAARRIIDTEGGDALSLRRLADELGIRQPSLYKHVAGKAEIEAAVIETGLRDLGAAVAKAPPELGAVVTAFRRWASAHAQLWRMMTARPFPRGRLPDGLESTAAQPLLAACGGDDDLARAVWASAYGFVALELGEYYPPGADLEAAWAALVGAYTTLTRARL